MPQSGVLKASKLLMVLGLWSLPVLAQAQAKPAASPSSDTPAPATQEQKTPAPTSAPAPAAAAAPPAAQAPASAAANPSGYAGAEACQACHADIYTGWEKGAHWKQTYKEGGIAKHGCEDCHGAAASHVADPSDTSKLFLFEKASTKEINARCLTCHASGPQQMSALNSEHSKNDVSCISCHSPHHATTSNFL